MIFEPGKHPRDVRGRWRKVLSGLKSGQTAELPDGTRVKNTGSGNVSHFEVVSPSGKKSSIRNVADAADHALQVSGQHSSPKSLGGTRSHPTLPRALQAHRKQARKQQVQEAASDAKQERLGRKSGKTEPSFRSGTPTTRRAKEKRPTSGSVANDARAVLEANAADTAKTARRARKLKVGERLTLGGTGGKVQIHKHTDTKGEQQQLTVRVGDKPVHTGSNARLAARLAHKHAEKRDAPSAQDGSVPTLARKNLEAIGASKVTRENLPKLMQQTGGSVPSQAVLSYLVPGLREKFQAAMEKKGGRLSRSEVREVSAKHLAPPSSPDAGSSSIPSLARGNLAAIGADSVTRENLPKLLRQTGGSTSTRAVLSHLLPGLDKKLQAATEKKDGRLTKGEIREIADKHLAAGTTTKADKPKKSKDSSTLETPSASDPSADEPIDVGDDVNRAADLLAQGKKVRLDQRRSASTLVQELADRVNAHKAKGEEAPDFDLCKVTVKNTNLFCAESKGIPRIKMPQLSGVPIPGSRADALPKNDKGEVNLSALFREHLGDNRGVAITDRNEKASFLRPSQIELNGGKVAGMTKVLDSGGTLGGDPRIFVSRDNYVVDGHHRWAAHVAHDLHDGEAGDVEMPVASVDMDIITLLDESNRFAEDWGIPQAGVGAQVPKSNDTSYHDEVPLNPDLGHLSDRKLLEMVSEGISEGGIGSPKSTAASTELAARVRRRHPGSNLANALSQAKMAGPDAHKSLSDAISAMHTKKEKEGTAGRLTRAERAQAIENSGVLPILEERGVVPLGKNGKPGNTPTPEPPTAPTPPAKDTELAPGTPVSMRDYHGIATGRKREIPGERAMEEVLLKRKGGDRVSATSFERKDLTVTGEPHPDSGGWARRHHDALSHNAEVRRARENLKNPAANVEPPPHISNEKWEKMSEKQRQANLSEAEREEMNLQVRRNKKLVKHGEVPVPPPTAAAHAALEGNPPPAPTSQPPPQLRSVRPGPSTAFNLKVGDSIKLQGDSATYRVKTKPNAEQLTLVNSVTGEETTVPASARVAAMGAIAALRSEPGGSTKSKTQPKSKKKGS